MNAPNDDLVRTYRYLCRRGAMKFVRPGLERSDLEQIASIGLIKASRRFDPASGTPFEAYAWGAVVGELAHFVRDHEHFIRVPRRLQTLDRRYARAASALRNRLGREPRDTEVASELGIDGELALELWRARAMTSTAPLTDATSLRCERARNFEERTLLALAVDSLADLDRRVVLGLYMAGLTQMELSRRLGVPRKTIARAHRSALATMQRFFAA
jgi:RNA polymerase sigma-B factor